jgi:predicted nucleic-acid-binding protein
MTGLDTNVLVRAVTADDPAQTRTVTRLFRTLTVQAPGYISLVCLAEFVWVLRRTYRYPQSSIVDVIRHFLEAPEFVFENQSAVEQSLHVYSATRSDFADCLIERAGHIAGCTATVTFDKGAAKVSGMRLL